MTAERKPDIATDRFMLVHGAVIVGQTNGVQVAIKPYVSGKVSLLPVSGVPAGVYPRSDEIPLAFDVAIGTVEEHVDHFRKYMLRAIEYLWDPASATVPWAANAAYQKQLQDLGIAEGACQCEGGATAIGGLLQDGDGPVYAKWLAAREAIEPQKSALTVDQNRWFDLLLRPPIDPGLKNADGSDAGPKQLRAMLRTYLSEHPEQE